MLLTTKLKAAPVGLSVLILLVLAASAFGQSTKQSKSARRQLADQLNDFKYTTYTMLQEADTLSLSTSRKDLGWMSHSRALNDLRDHVNRLGKLLAKLEAQKSAGTEGQALAIEHARPDLVSVARNLTQAIALVNENRYSVNQEDYADAVSNMYAHADALYHNTDAILDYEEAGMRLDELELRPATNVVRTD